MYSHSFNCSCEPEPIYKDGLQFGIMTVNKCPPNYPNTEEKELCDETESWMYHRIHSSSLWPVSDPTTGVRYVVQRPRNAVLSFFIHHARYIYVVFCLVAFSCEISE